MTIRHPFSSSIIVTRRPFSSVVEETARARLCPPRPELELELEEELTLTLELLDVRDRLEAEANARPRRRLERAERWLCSHRVAS